jgi:hypothetical protein
MHVTGSCQCGAIRYEAEVDPATSGVCHCTDCQKFSGSPWRASVRARAETLTLTGEPHVYVKTAESGTRRGQAFCPTCGSALYAFTPPDPEIVNLRLGAVDQRADLPPQAQIWCDSALPWSQDISGLPGRPKQ